MDLNWNMKSTEVECVAVRIEIIGRKPDQINLRIIFLSKYRNFSAGNGTTDACKSDIKQFIIKTHRPT